ncbi:hypothetical protein CYMTET_35849, partial [Cymbomonas tetramitiformis]
MYCDDGGAASSYDACELGTDCTDCGVRYDCEQLQGGGLSCPELEGFGCECVSSPPPPRDSDSNHDAQNLVDDASLCEDTCVYSDDMYCDDGGAASSYDACELGTDCTDCGVRYDCEQLQGGGLSCPELEGFGCECVSSPPPPGDNASSLPILHTEGSTAYVNDSTYAQQHLHAAIRNASVSTVIVSVNISLTDSDTPPLTRALYISGECPGEALCMIDGGGRLRLFNVSQGAHLTLSGLMLMGGNARDGGAIRAFGDANVTLRGCNLWNNTAEYSGGAIRVDHGHVTVTAVDVAFNRAVLHGAFLGSPGGVTMTLSNSTFRHNCAELGKGGVMSLSGEVNHNFNGINDDVRTVIDIGDCDFLANTADKDGAVYYSTVSVTVEVTRSRFAKNSGLLRELASSVICIGTATPMLPTVAFEQCSFAEHFPEGATNVGRLVFAYGFHSLNFTDCLFRDNFPSENGPLISANGLSESSVWENNGAGVSAVTLVRCYTVRNGLLMELRTNVRLQ